MRAGFVALGLVQGALAALNALGLVLLWRTSRVVNLAQSATGLVGGVLTGMLVAGAGWSFWWAAPLGVATGAALGFAAERLVMVRLASLPRTVPMVATIGLAALFHALQSGIPFLLGGRLPSYDVDVGVELFVFPVLLKGPHLLALAVLPVALAAAWWFLHRTRIGIAATAVGQDVERAQTLGVNAGFVRGVSWGMAGALSGVAGVLSIPVLGFSLGDGVAPTVLLLALAPAVLAGLRSLAGTVVASLAVGVGYQVALVEAPTAGTADVLLAVVLVAALALRRGRIGREALGDRASSWAAASSAGPLPRAVRRDPRWRVSTRLGAVTLVVLATLPPLWLAPSGDVRYGTGAALAVAAVAAAAAWLFSGEIVLGHWGVAALGAATAALAPGPLAGRVVVGVAAGVVAGVALAAAGARGGGLTTAVGGLALSVAAPAWLLHAELPAPAVDGSIAAAAAGALAAGAVVAVTWLRGRRIGVAMVAARDDSRRAAALGVRTAHARVTGMALSGGLAALAGVAYLAAVPAGVAPGAFDATRSLDVLAFAVVGGLGSALGAGLGAALLVTAGVVLPSPWASVATGFGVLWIVLFCPSGLGGVLASARDRLAYAVCPGGFAPRPGTPGVDAGASGSSDDGDDRLDVATVALVAGADTREALGIPTVRAAMAAAFCLGAPSLAALFGSTSTLRDHVGVDLGRLAPWYVMATAAVAAGVMVVGWRSDRADAKDGVATEVLVSAGLAAALVAFSASRDPVLVTVVLLAGPVLGGWVLVRLARLAASAAVLRTRSAAVGLVAAAAGAAGLGALQLAVVAAGEDLLAAARWAVPYLVAGTAATAVAIGRAPEDTRRARQRASATVTAAGRRYWAPLRVEALTVDYGAQRVLDGVDLHVDVGEVVAVVGGNGAGKSTLLRAVAGLVEPVGGRVDVAGEEVTGLRPDERAAVGLALASGARPVFPDLSVGENLRVGAFLTHRSAASFAAALDHVLALVPVLRGRLAAPASVLSGGEQRRLAIAQALFRRPTVLLADELALGLDGDARAAVFALLRTLADDGIAVVVVDHDIEALARVADRFVVVHDGTTTGFADATALADVKGGLLSARFLAGAPG